MRTHRSRRFVGVRVDELAQERPDHRRGPFLDAGDSTLAITGGTGAFRNAGGTMDRHARDAQGTAYDFTFHVIRNDD